jgi:hypothetical protein
VAGPVTFDGGIDLGGNKITNLGAPVAPTDAARLMDCAGGGATFITLPDCPASYVGQKGRLTRVNNAENGIQFVGGNGDYILAPVMTTLNLPAVPVKGMIVFDDTIGQFLGYNGIAWVIIG